MALPDKKNPKRGEVWLVDFSPAIGSEIRDPHPAVIVSVDDLVVSPKKTNNRWGSVVLTAKLDT